jgi:hypothetical protein
LESKNTFSHERHRYQLFVAAARLRFDRPSGNYYHLSQHHEPG